MSGGYNQFFKAAKKTKNESLSHTFVKSTKSKSPSDDLIDEMFAGVEEGSGKGAGDRAKRTLLSKQKMKMSGANSMKSMESDKSSILEEERLKKILKVKTPRKIGKKSRSIISMGAGIVIAASTFFYIDEIVNFVSGVEVGAFSKAKADSSKKDSKKEEESSSSKEGAAAKNSGQSSNANLDKKMVKKGWSEEELNVFKKLDARKKELDQREEEIREMERELQEQKVSIDKKIEKLAKMRADIAKVLEDRISADNDKVQRLVEFYSNMKPQNAAEVFSELNEDLAVEVLGRMKKKDAANILNLLKPEKAQKLTEQYAGYRRGQ